MTEDAARDSRNIIDYYWYWKTEAIKAELDIKRHKFSILCSNLYNDFNIGCIIRNANAFLASKVYIYGRRRFDRRSTVGTHHYENLVYIPTIDDLTEIAKSHTIVAMENNTEAQDINNFVWPESPIIAFGQEQVGLPQEILDMSKHVVYIPQYGSVRSLNVACAAAIAMQDWCRKNAKPC